MWKQKVLNSVQERQNVGMEDVPRGGRKKTFSHWWFIVGRSRLSCKKKSYIDIHVEKSSGKILEKNSF
jgi:hypothetical protein